MKDASKMFQFIPLRVHFQLNPRLTKLFSPVNLKNERLRYAYLVPYYIVMGLIFPYIPKNVQTSHHNDVIIVDFAKTTDLQ